MILIYIFLDINLIYFNFFLKDPGNLNDNNTVIYTVPTTHQITTAYPTQLNQPQQSPSIICQDTPPSYEQAVRTIPTQTTVTVVHPTQVIR